MTTTKQPAQLRVRPSAKVKKLLKAEAKKAGRTLSSEMALRLEASFGEANPASAPRPFAAWPAKEAEDFQNFGDLVAQLYVEVTRRLGTGAARKRRLGYMRSSISALLDTLDADQISEVEADWNARITHDLLTDEHLKHLASIKSLDVTYTPSDLARNFSELKARVDGKEK